RARWWRRGASRPSIRDAGDAPRPPTGARRRLAPAAKTQLPPHIRVECSSMRRIFRLTAAAIVLGATIAPDSALADQIELGATHSPLVAPVCPPGVSSSNCTIILTRVTALQTLRDGAAYPTRVTKPGRIVAFTVGLSALSTNKSTQKSFIHFLDATYGGTARLGITVLAPIGKRTQWQWQVVAESPIYHVQPYLGTVVQIPLETSIEVKPGEVI